MLTSSITLQSGLRHGFPPFLPFNLGLQSRCAVFPRFRIRTRLATGFFSTRIPPKPNGTPSEEPTLPGTVPSHRSYIILNSPSPPSSLPSRFSTPIQRSLQLRVTRWGGVVNFAWTGSPDPDDKSTSVIGFSPLGGRINIPVLSLSNIDEVAEELRQHAIAVPTSNTAPDSTIHIYICTHGARDCRCGDIGGAVVRALREDLSRRVAADPHGPASNVVVGEVAHVGGHKFAANMLVFPQGEWLGSLTAEDVPRVLDTILSSYRRPYTTESPLCPEFWRGRMGLPKDEQLALHASSSRL
ncbi:Sucrase/ferredoxin-like-domain-containing protein [Mycena rebaudengoi]|nr:Sucrase/ferredoxin-like-domain-containing protein [Mycena rebaudengoi]